MNCSAPFYRNTDAHSASDKRALGLRYKMYKTTPENPCLLGLTQRLLPGVLSPWRKAAHSLPSSAEVNKYWSYATTTPKFFMTFN